MDKEEYKSALKELDAELEKKKVALIKQYVDANAKFNVGDIITDGNTIIKIEKRGYYLSISDPEARYIGVQLKKDLTEAKRQNDTIIYGNREITKLN